MTDYEEKGRMVFGAVALVAGVVILVAITGLIVGQILGQSIFSSSTIINTTELENGFSDFISGIIGFLAVIGVTVGVVWLIMYLKALFSRKDGIQSFAGN